MTGQNSIDNMRFSGRGEFDKAIHTLEGILKGISIDDEINIQELNELDAWCYMNYRFVDRQPYKELIPYIAEAIKDNYLDSEEQENILWYCKNFQTDNVFYDLVTSDLQRLQGIMHGIMSDNNITEDEIKNLKNWLLDNNHLKSIYPYDELCELVNAVIEDGKIDEDEDELLKLFFTDHIIPARYGTIDRKEISDYKKRIVVSGICTEDPRIEFENKKFCFTGKSAKTRRSEFIRIVEKHKGKYDNKVSGNTDYLIIGDNGNPCWAYSCYGRKVEHAVAMRKEGVAITIALENDFWSAVP
ncbi:MAG: BRCT domain-containing protein [Spirochaetales bacterium]|nr:BRCT domain-containing protein [Spirochaetales bacterium]